MICDVGLQPSEDEPLLARVERLRSFIEGGGQVVGQLAGAAFGILAGPLVGAGTGAMLGEALSRVGVELYARFLAPRQGARAAGALAVAVVKVEERLEAGDEPRRDGFFDRGPDGRADADEVLEGTLLTAANAYEERKVPLIGRLWANLVFDETVSARHANYLLRLADRLTYGQLVALAFFHDAQSGDYEHALIGLQGSGPLPSPALLAELDDLSAARLLGLRQTDGSVIAPTEAWSPSNWSKAKLAQAALMPVGDRLWRLMELHQLPSADVDAVLTDLRGYGAT
jgi:hypothetical protein